MPTNATATNPLPGILTAALCFSALMVLLSYIFNRRFMAGSLHRDPYALSLTSATVFCLAVIGESLINPLYMAWQGHKLWEYHLFPLHDADVSALSAAIWSAYGIHLYFLLQNLDRILPADWRNPLAKALLIGFEAPLVFEVLGNLFFLSLLGRYYAYYLPDDIGHLSSFQVVPIYILSIYCGLLCLKQLHRLPRHWAVPGSIFCLGVAYLSLG